RDNQAFYQQNELDYLDEAVLINLIKNDQSVLDKQAECLFIEYGIEEEGKRQHYLVYKKPLYNPRGVLKGLMGVSLPFNHTQGMDEVVDKQALFSRLQSYKSELAYLKKIIDLVPGNLYWKNRQGVYLGCNQGTLDAVGGNTSACFVGKTLQQVVPEEDRKHVEMTDEKVMQSGQVFSGVEHVVESGSDHYYISKKVPMQQNGITVGMIGLSFDITKQKTLENNLMKMTKERFR
ncbi:unnamed protein product, partial [marine sediment metagenome]